MVVIVWQLDLHLPMQSLPITTIVIFSGYPVSPTNNTDRYDIAEILLKVVLSTITLAHLVDGHIK